MKTLFRLMFALVMALALSTQLHAFQRIISQYGNLTTSSEVFASGTAGPPFYTRTFTTDPGTDTLFIDLSGTADTHNGAVNLIKCVLDGINCNPGAHFSGALPGWFAWQRTCGPSNPGACPGVPAGAFYDLHDNSVTSRWCVQVPGDVTFGGTHTLTLFLGSNPGGGNNASFFEAWHLSVDEEATGGECFGS